MPNQPLENGMLKVIQLTDTHLFANDESAIFDVKSNVTFNEVIDRIFTEDLSGLHMIFLTGDVSQDETEQSYHHLVECLDKFPVPVYWIPGNHDDIFKMERIFSTAQNFIQTRALLTPYWDFIFLNTKLDGHHEGYLSPSELDSLENKIKESENKRLTIIMHHHPIEVNTPLIDNYILKNRSEFWEVIENTKVELIICGHVHGDYRLSHKNISIETSPATCLQWQHGPTDLKIENKIGYKIYYFGKNEYNSISKIW